MINRASYHLGMVLASVVAFAGAATAATVDAKNSTIESEDAVVGPVLTNDAQTVVYLADVDGELEFRGWTDMAMSGTVGSDPVVLSVNADPSRAVGLQPGLAATIFLPPTGWNFGETYLAGEPVRSVVSNRYVTVFFRNEYVENGNGTPAPYGRFLRLQFFNSSGLGWVEAEDGSPFNPVAPGDATLTGVSGVPLPASAPLLAGALLGVFALRRRLSATA